MWPLWVILGFFGFMLIFYLVFFLLILPKMRESNERQKRLREEEKIRKQQQKIALEKEKFELELLKQKSKLDAESEAERLRPKFCQYCGTKIPAGGDNCPSCGASLRQ